MDLCTNKVNESQAADESVWQLLKRSVSSAAVVCLSKTPADLANRHATKHARLANCRR